MPFVCVGTYHQYVLRIGPAGWSYKDWAGIVYPDPPPKGFHGAAYLSWFFDTIEINSTFYRPPTPEAAKAWAKRVAENKQFRFTAKLWRGFTHERKATPADEAEFKAGIEPLMEANRLGALLLQFPISFKNTPEERAYLLGLHRRFADCPLVIEVRHSSWTIRPLWRCSPNSGSASATSTNRGSEHRCARLPRRRPEIGYVRLHGRNYKEWFAENRQPSDRYNYLYTVKELEPWADRIRSVTERTRSTYVVTNNHFQGKAVVNAIQLAALLGQSIEAPPRLVARYPALRELRPIH